MENTRLKAAIRPAAHRLASFLSSAYVAGPGLIDGVEAIDRFGRSGYRGTLGYFNADDESAERIADLGVESLEALALAARKGYVSIKAPALQFDADLINKIGRASARTGVAIHFDSHSFDDAEATFAAIDVALAQTPQVGCTLPGRWKRSLDDVERVAQRNLRVRVVKGQWADPEQPNVDLATSYLALIDRLAGRVRVVGVATHDPVLAREALGRLRAAGTDCELELLFGLPMRASLLMAREEQVPVCVYVPFGQGWMPYALSQLRRNPGIAFWMMKDLVAAATLKSRG